AAPVGARLLGSPQKLGERVVALRVIAVSGRAGIGIAVVRARIFAIIGALLALGARGVDLAAVEAPAFVGVAKQIVGAGDFLEFLLRGLVAGIEIGVQLLGQIAKRLLDLGRGGGRLYPEDFIRTFHSSHPRRSAPLAASAIERAPKAINSTPTTRVTITPCLRKNR